MYVRFPLLPFFMVTVLVAEDNPVPVQPVKVYPVLLGVGNVKVAVVEVYFVFCPEILPPLRLYLIVYVVAIISG